MAKLPFHDFVISLPCQRPPPARSLRMVDLMMPGMATLRGVQSRTFGKALDFGECGGTVSADCGDGVS
jgi:hypothetical protein